ncbi:peptidase M23B [sediment metagenome]|uniref:Peptidase M23B n=1 Tax=sediment metagenome TaxID=749907 RepID=D9PN47_9ZZZZ
MINKFKTSVLFYLKKSLILALKASHFTVLFLKKVFGKKTILLVSKQQIKSYSIGPAAQIIFLFFVLWIGNIFTRSLGYNSVIESKSVEINNLKKANQQFESEVDSLNLNLQKLNSYFSSISGYNPQGSDTAPNQQNIDKKVNDLFGDISLNKQDREIAIKIADSNLMLDSIKGATIKRITDLEQKLAITGIALVNNKAVLRSRSNNNSDNQNAISLNNKDDLTKRQGGPFQDLRRSFDNISGSKIFGGDNKVSIKNEIEYLANLENFLRHVPLIAPIKDYYVSSGFGKRSDPMRRVLAKHDGMDFVGKSGAKIISPSPGKVLFAGKFSTYGNALIIDHGYGITTRYGHLSKIYVDRGSYVEKNQIVAAQGSTGRSTGQHLHYEVRYKNIPLNPKNFLQAGQEILNSNNS